MRRPQPGEYGDFYQGYIDRTRGADFLQNLEDSGSVLLEYLNTLPEDKRNYAYAPDKWRINQVLQHVIDTDTVFSYRALWIARNGKGELKGYDHEIWAENSLNAKLHWTEQIEQFRNLRNFSIGMFHSFTETILNSQAVVNGYQTSLRSIPFIMAGHTFHHLAVLQERY